jgi:hypothetical protein
MAKKQPVRQIKDRPRPYLSLLIIILVLVIFLYVAVEYVIPKLAPEPNHLPDEKFCNSDADCACGTHIKTGECFTGNKAYVNIEKQCPDFCTGIAAMFTTACIDNVCQQVRI